MNLSSPQLGCWGGGEAFRDETRWERAGDDERGKDGQRVRGREGGRDGGRGRGWKFSILSSSTSPEIIRLRAATKWKRTTYQLRGHDTHTHTHTHTRTLCAWLSREIPTNYFSLKSLYCDAATCVRSNTPAACYCEAAAPLCGYVSAVIATLILTYLSI